MGFEFLTLHPERVARQDGRANLITDPSHLIPMTSVKGNKLRVGSEEVGDDLEARLTFVGTMRWLQVRAMDDGRVTEILEGDRVEHPQ